jgi:hypothetical protein
MPAGLGTTWSFEGTQVTFHKWAEFSQIVHGSFMAQEVPIVGLRSRIHMS